MKYPKLWKILVVFTALIPVAVLAAATQSSFTIAIIPDTQNYTDYRHQKAEGFPFDAGEIFLEQMRYVAQHAESAGGDIAFVTSVGDMWQHASLLMDPGHEARGFRRVPNPAIEQWITPMARSYEMPLVKRGYELISGKVPFSVVPGNHDYDAFWRGVPRVISPDAKDPSQSTVAHVGGLSNFSSVFSPDSPFFKGRKWYVASHDGGADSAQVFTGGGYRFLHIGLQFDAPDASLVWAAEVIKRFPGLPTIISTHNYLDPGGERRFGVPMDNNLIDPQDNHPQLVWEKLISQNDQIFLVLCGHRTSSGRRIENNRFGHPVYQLLSDFQDRKQTAIAKGVDKPPGNGIGDGWMRLMTFDMSGQTPIVRVRTYSTHYRKFSNEMSEYAGWYKADDELSALSDAEYNARDDFSRELSGFRGRFARAKN
jgi:hypothetical protein